MNGGHCIALKLVFVKLRKQNRKSRTQILSFFPPPPPPPLHRGSRRRHRPIMQFTITSSIENMQNIGFKTLFRTGTFHENDSWRQRLDRKNYYNLQPGVQRSIGAQCYRNLTHNRYSLIVQRDNRWFMTVGVRFVVLTPQCLYLRARAHQGNWQPQRNRNFLELLSAWVEHMLLNGAAQIEETVLPVSLVCRCRRPNTCSNTRFVTVPCERYSRNFSKLF
jgi:hypothetical protein